MKCNFQIENSKVENEYFAIAERAKNKRIRDEQKYIIRKNEINNNHIVNMEENKRKKEKDAQKNHQDLEKIYRNDQRKLQQLNNDYLFKKKKK